jgi:hypothetical protein
MLATLMGGYKTRPLGFEEILNPKHEIPDNIKIQKSKVKSQNDKAKCKSFDKGGCIVSKPSTSLSSER